MEDEKEKTLELYTLVKSAYAESIDIFTKLEEKANKHLTLMGILLIPYGITVNNVLEKFHDFYFGVNYLLLFLLLSTFIAIIFSIIRILKSLQIDILEQVSVDTELVDFFKSRQYIEVINAMIRGYMKAIAYNEETANEKIKFVKNAHNTLKISIYLLSIIYIIIAVQPLL